MIDYRGINVYACYKKKFTIYNLANSNIGTTFIHCISIFKIVENRT